MDKAQRAIMGTQSNKLKDLAKDTVDISSKAPLTTDFGVKNSGTDHWLGVTNEDNTGPMLLEDQFGREKVAYPTRTVWCSWESWKL